MSNDGWVDHLPRRMTSDQFSSPSTCCYCNSFPVGPVLVSRLSPLRTWSGTVHLVPRRKKRRKRRRKKISTNSDHVTILMQIFLCIGSFPMLSSLELKVAASSNGVDFKFNLTLRHFVVYEPCCNTETLINSSIASYL